MPAPSIRATIVVITATSLALVSSAATFAAGASDPDGHGGGSFTPPRDGLSADWYRSVEAEADRNADRLGLRALSIEGTPVLVWPLEASGLGNFSYTAISYFVDQDADGGQLLDFDCGERTYDGHRGVDIYPWPYWWLVMSKEAVRVLAAAPGTIVTRSDGNFDQRCACLTDDPNYLIVQHADGSRAWYLHMKSGTVTAKGIGETVATGELLGRIGSSGCSSGPHLHFEVHDAGTDPGPLLDPFEGACNSLNPSSLWGVQRPYYEPAINRLSTNSAPPVFPACPGIETPNEKRIFAPGDTIYVITFLHDETPDFSRLTRVRRPDGTLALDVQETSDQAYSSSYWWWYWTGANPITSGPTGRWSFEVTIDGTTRKRAFWIGALFADDFEDEGLGAWSSSTP